MDASILITNIIPRISAAALPPFSQLSPYIPSRLQYQGNMYRNIALHLVLALGANLVFLSLPSSALCTATVNNVTWDLSSLVYVIGGKLWWSNM